MDSLNLSQRIYQVENNRIMDKNEGNKSCPRNDQYSGPFKTKKTQSSSNSRFFHSESPNYIESEYKFHFLFKKTLMIPIVDFVHLSFILTPQHENGNNIKRTKKDKKMARNRTEAHDFEHVERGNSEMQRKTEKGASFKT